jgi:hypothetical protein
MNDRITQTKKTIVLADGVEYEVKPLTLKESKEIIPLIKDLGDLDNLSEDIINKTAELCLKILSKSISGLTIDRVLSLVDLGNVQQIILIASGR